VISATIRLVGDEKKTEKPKRSLSDDEVVTERSKSARAIATVKGGAAAPPGPNDPQRQGGGHGDPDH
jgi:hypothetical protein